MAEKFVQLGERLGCKHQVRFAPAHKSWKCVFTRTKPARVLFTVDCTHRRWSVKACLWELDRYTDALHLCSDRIKTMIQSAYNCKNCNSRCRGGVEFTFAETSYKKCVGCCFYFSNLAADEWEDLLTLLECEYRASGEDEGYLQN